MEEDVGFPRITHDQGERLRPRVAQSTNLERLVDGVEPVLWQTDARGPVTFASRRAVELLGYPQELWLGLPCLWHKIAHPEDREKARVRFWRCARHGRPAEHRYRVIAADRRVVWIRESLRPASNGAGQIDGVFGTSWVIEPPRNGAGDVRRAHRVLAARVADLAQLDELCRRLWNTPELAPLLDQIVADATEILGADMGVVRLCDAPNETLDIATHAGMPDEYLEKFGRLPVREVAYGWTIQQGSPLILEDIEQDPAAEAYRDAVRAGGYRSKCITLLMSRNGELLGTLAACFREPHRPTRRQVRLFERFARRAADFVDNALNTESVRKADQRKEDALATLAHELRNPLAVIINSAHILELSDLDEITAQETRKLIGHQARLMSQLADDLFESSRAGRGEAQLHPELVNLRSVMIRAAESARRQLEERQHQFLFDAPDESICLKADPMRLEQVFVNLLANAARYTEPGGQIRFSGQIDADSVVVRVSDTGVGIPADMLERIFDPFVQERRATTCSGQGMGLGLSLVKGFVERHGGTVTATSEGPNRGSEFVIRLPAKSNERLDSSRHIPYPSQESAERASEVRVLVVDDQRDSAQLLARLLAAWGYKPTVSFDGPTALEQAAAHQPHVVLLDIGLPGMSGYEVARRLRAGRDSELRIIALTGFRHDQKLDEHDSLFDLYLVKPVSPPDLRASLGDS
jgi:PAS domain S-box-containing protein